MDDTQRDLLISDLWSLTSLLFPLFYFLIRDVLHQTRPTKKEMKISNNATADTVPVFSAIQLKPTMGNRLMRTIALRLSCFFMKSAIGGE
jgi:hypothetical protein